MIFTEGNARALHFSFDRANFHVIIQSGLGPVLGFSLFLYFRHPCAGGNNTRPCHDCQERLDSVQQQQKAVSAAEEFCIQIHAIKLAVKPQQK